LALPLGKHSGRHAFLRACTEAGIHPDAAELHAAFSRFKRPADERKAVTVCDVFEEVPTQ
jgi:isopropylmalate/homocitrate/citramalate synthase